MELIILIYIIVFGGYFFINNYKYGFNGGTFLIALFFSGSVLGFYILLTTNFYDPNRLNFFAVIYHCVCLLMFLSPIVYVSNKLIHKFRVPNQTGLKLFVYLLLFFSLFSFISLIPKIQSVFAVGDLKTARNLYNYGDLHEEGGGILAYLGGIGASFAYFSMFLFFYYLKNFPKERGIIVLLFLCSLTDALSGLSVAGRGGIMRWILMLLFFYFSFHRYIDQKLKRKMIRIVSLMSVPLIAIFTVITIARFSNREYPIYVYVFDYLGQSFLYFSYIFNPFFDSTFGGRMNFPIFFPNDRIDRVLSEEVSANFNLNTFSTFVGSFYKDIGFYRTLLIATVFWIFSTLIFKFSRVRNNFYKSIIFITFSQMIVNGVFYFQYTGTTKIRSFIVLVFLAFIIELKFPRMPKRIE